MPEIVIPTCPACGEALHSHWQCALCRCLGHANIQAQYDPQLCQDCVAALARRNLRRCRGCGQIKPLDRFAPTASDRRWKCRTCGRGKAKYSEAKRERQRKWREANRDHYNAQARGYWHAKREQYLKSKRKYYQAHIEAQRAYRRRYYAANREQQLAGMRLYRTRRKLAVLRSWKEARDAR